MGFLCATFDDRRRALLKEREAVATEYDGGALPSYPVETRESVRENNTWMCAPPPADISDRRVEITGPVDRKMVINGLNSGASTYMADFEDSSSPTWSVVTEGQRNLREAVRGTISYTNPANGKVYVPRSDGKVSARGAPLWGGRGNGNGALVAVSSFLYLSCLHD